MQVLFKFQCSRCGKEVLSDGVVARCCERLMEHKETYSLTEREVYSLVHGLERLEEIVERKDGMGL